MDISAIKGALSDIEGQMNSSTDKIDDKIRGLHNELRDLRLCLEQKNENIKKLKNDNDELLALSETILGLFKKISNQKLIEGLDSISGEVKVLTSAVKQKENIAANAFDVDFNDHVIPSEYE